MFFRSAGNRSVGGFGESASPKYENCRQKVEEINTLLWEKCRKEGFIYIDQSNIGLADMGDMIHVGQHGLHKLKDNVLNQLHTYKTPPPSNHYH